LSGQVEAEQLAILVNQKGALLPLSLSRLRLARPLTWALAWAWLKRDKFARVGRRCGLLLLVELHQLKLPCVLL
jgi:hypothetical protein